jgi:pyrroline-5-carboxylate reductase
MDKITIIGAGNLGFSIITGLAASNLFDATSITVADKSKSRVDEIKKSLKVSTTTDSAQAIKASKWIILCVQPRHIDAAIEEIKSNLTDKQVLISTVLGKSIQDISGLASTENVVRVMPNTASSIKQSMTCICAGKNVKEADVEFVGKMFDTIGKTLVVEEHLIQSATVLGASGIAFVLRFISAMMQGGVQMGFHPHEAQLIAMQTTIGAASLLTQENAHPETEINKVTTPSGCTIEGLNEMEHNGLSSSVIQGLMAAYDKINKVK